MTNCYRLLPLATLLLGVNLNAVFELPEGFSRPGERNMAGELVLSVLTDAALKDKAELVAKGFAIGSWLHKTFDDQVQKLTTTRIALDTAVAEVAQMMEQLAGPFLPRIGVNVSAEGIELAMQAINDDKNAITKLEEVADKWRAARDAYEGARAGLLQDLAQYNK